MTYPSGMSVYSPKIRDSSVVRKMVSQNGSGYLALMVFDGQNPVDPVANSVALKVWYDSTNPEVPYEDPRGELILSVDDHTGTNTIQRESEGKFYYNIGPEHTANRGVLTAEWTYEVNGHEFKFTDYLQILEQMPLYETLNEDAKYIIDSVMWLLGDLFDSTEGGPFLIENFQTKWSYERLAHLMEASLARVNLTGQPPTAYSIFQGRGKKLPKEYLPLLSWSLRIEAIRHLIRSYTEIPTFTNMNVTYTDRTQYAERWRRVLDDEKEDLKEAIINTKRNELSLARGSLIVAGGYYGNMGMFTMGSQIQAQRSMRFYPSAPSISFGYQARSG